MKIFAHVLSVDHVKFKNLVPQRRSKRKTKKHFYGSKTTPKVFSWSLDPFKQNQFISDCLLVAIIFGLLQNAYFSNQDKRFLYVQNINSKYEHKRRQARKIIEKELKTIKECLGDNLLSGPYDVSVLKKLSEILKCQFVIFCGEKTTTRIKHMVPSTFNNEYQPIYLYEPINDQHHIVFILNLQRFYRQNLTFCFYCKKTFKSAYYRHRCLRAITCFACRRPFANEKTYLNNHIKKTYCDIKISQCSYNVNCLTCNVSLQTIHCATGHKNLCNGQGYFGYKV